MNHPVYYRRCSGEFNLTYNYLVTDWSGETTRVSAAEYEAGLFASVDVAADVSEFSAANQLEIIVYKTYLDVTDNWLFGHALAMTYSASNAGIKSDPVALLLFYAVTNNNNDDDDDDDNKDQSTLAISSIAANWRFRPTPNLHFPYSRLDTLSNTVLLWGD